MHSEISKLHDRITMLVSKARKRGKNQKDNFFYESGSQQKKW